MLADRIWTLGCSALGITCLGCAPELPQIYGAPPDAGVHVRFEPAPPEYGVPSFRAVWSGRLPQPYPRLFSGDVSSSQRKRAREGELPGNLEERLRPLFTYENSAAQMSVALDRLAPGRFVFQLGADDWFPFQVTSRQGTWLRREWPAGGASAGSAIYCVTAEGRSAPSLSSLSFAPGEIALLPEGNARVEPIQDGCAAVTVTRAPRAGAVTPLEFNGWPMEPTVFRSLGAVPDYVPQRCSSGFQPLACACVGLLDDRLIIDAPLFDTYWIFRGTTTLGESVAAGDRVVVLGVERGLRQSVEVSVLDQHGRRFYSNPLLEPGEVLPHIVINEVMANPLGPEPAQEWVELYNDGIDPIDLKGFRLGDAAQLAELPRATIKPGRFALVVSEAFDVSADGDIDPEKNALILRVSRLGKGGLSNAGESLRLLSPSGKVVSRFSSHPKPRPGNSVARRTPRSLDAVENSFGLHGDPGASPGRENFVP